MRVTCAERPDLAGRIEGSRKDRWVTVTFELPVVGGGFSLELRFSPVALPLPTGCTEAGRWQAARRGWFNFIQLSCGASGGGTGVKGVWANNVLSDPVSSVLYMLADATLLVPELAPGVRMAPILRRAVEYWMDRKTDLDGLVAYTAGGREQGWDQNVMDANPAVLIGAWAYVTASGDRAWLERRIADLERLSHYIELSMTTCDKDDSLTPTTPLGPSGHTWRHPLVKRGILKPTDVGIAAGATGGDRSRCDRGGSADRAAYPVLPDRCAGGRPMA